VGATESQELRGESVVTRNFPKVLSDKELIATLQSDNRWLTSCVVEQRETLRAQERALEQKESQLLNLKSRCESLESQIVDIHDSLIWKVGKVVTWPARKLREVFTHDPERLPLE